METFNDVISGNQLVLVDFFATWCQPCKMMHPVLDQVKATLGDRIRIVKVDVDQHGITAGRHQVRSVPTLMLFRSDRVGQCPRQTCLPSSIRSLTNRTDVQSHFKCLLYHG